MCQEMHILVCFLACGIVLGNPHGSIDFYQLSVKYWDSQAMFKSYQHIFTIREVSGIPAQLTIFTLVFSLLSPTGKAMIIFSSQVRHNSTENYSQVDWPSILHNDRSVIYTHFFLFWCYNHLTVKLLAFIIPKSVQLTRLPACAPCCFELQPPDKIHPF